MWWLGVLIDNIHNVTFKEKVKCKFNIVAAKSFGTNSFFLKKVVNSDYNFEARKFLEILNFEEIQKNIRSIITKTTKTFFSFSLLLKWQSVFQQNIGVNLDWLVNHHEITKACRKPYIGSSENKESQFITYFPFYVQLTL